jgi:hypothetical protein
MIYPFINIILHYTFLWLKPPFTFRKQNSKNLSYPEGMTKNPKLHIPQPTARPGEEPDFSYLNLSEAGAIERPPTDVR